MKKIPKKVLRHVNPMAHEMFAERALAGDWQGALILTDSERRISLYIDMTIAELIPRENTDALAYAISNGGVPLSERDMLIITLGRFLKEGRRVFDGDEARRAFEALPDQVTIYRGTAEAEADSREYGVCWTIDRDKAEWFATKHGRFRNTASAPVVLSANVNRADVCGLLWDRGEKEVLVLPRSLVGVIAEPVQ